MVGISGFEELPPGGRDEMADMLRAANLPTSDLDAPGRRFWRFLADGATVGFAGLEPYGADALLRSVVVTVGRRGQGTGAMLVRKVAQRAAELGIERLWLLTTTAPGFFAGLGFQTADRADAPPSIARSTEFAEICPASAVCMVLEIKGAADR